MRVQCILILVIIIVTPLITPLTIAMNLQVEWVTPFVGCYKGFIQGFYEGLSGFVRVESVAFNLFGRYFDPYRVPRVFSSPTILDK